MRTRLVAAVLITAWSLRGSGAGQAERSFVVRVPIQRNKGAIDVTALRARLGGQPLRIDGATAQSQGWKQTVLVADLQHSQESLHAQILSYVVCPAHTSKATLRIVFGKSPKLIRAVPLDDGRIYGLLLDRAALCPHDDEIGAASQPVYWEPQAENPFGLIAPAFDSSDAPVRVLWFAQDYRWHDLRWYEENGFCDPADRVCQQIDPPKYDDVRHHLRRISEADLHLFPVPVGRLRALAGKNSLDIAKYMAGVLGGYVIKLEAGRGIDSALESSEGLTLMLSGTPDDRRIPEEKTLTVKGKGLLKWKRLFILNPPDSFSRPDGWFDRNFSTLVTR